MKGTLHPCFVVSHTASGVRPWLEWWSYQSVTNSDPGEPSAEYWAQVEVIAVSIGRFTQTDLHSHVSTDNSLMTTYWCEGKQRVPLTHMALREINKYWTYINESRCQPTEHNLFLSALQHTPYVRVNPFPNLIVMYKIHLTLNRYQNYLQHFNPVELLSWHNYLA